MNAGPPRQQTGRSHRLTVYPYHPQDPYAQGEGETVTVPGAHPSPSLSPDTLGGAP